MAPDPPRPDKMVVDPDILRAIAMHLETEGDKMRGLVVDPDIEAVGQCLVGSAVQQACLGGSTVVEKALATVISRADHMAAVARGNADSYEVTEEEFATALQEMGEL